LARKLRIAPACYHVLHIIPAEIAHERNYFVDEGLAEGSAEYRYEIVPGGLVPFGLEQQGLGQGMKEKGIDIALDVLVATPLYHQLHPRGTEMAIIAGWRNQHQSMWMAQPGIKEAGQLRGRRIGVIDFGDILYRSLRPWLRQAGLDADTDVEWVRGVAPPKNAARLRAGDVDATFVPPWEAPDLLAEGFELIWDPKRDYPGGNPRRVITASRAVLDERPEEIVAFLRAMIRSYWYMRIQPDHYDVCYEIERRLRRASHDPDERTWRFHAKTPMHLETSPFPIDGMATGLETVVREDFDAGEFDRMPDIDAACRFEFVERAFTDLMDRPELKPDYQRMREIVAKVGY
jgi:ABC-type nitrate/sulfonate/bicarbonate transport system substrate-binding protein